VLLLDHIKYLGPKIQIKSILLNNKASYKWLNIQKWCLKTADTTCVHCSWQPLRQNVASF